MSAIDLDGREQCTLTLSGMTCASCASRIEKRLNALPGVAATVNLALERADVTFDRTAVTPDALVGAVEAIGYGASVVEQRRTDPAMSPAVAGAAPAGAHDHGDARDRDLAQRLLVSTILTIPVVAMAMIPALQIRHWQWLSLTLASPVVVWGGWPFHVSAWRGLRHGSASMDTLISLGSLSAFAWSVWALWWGDAGMEGMTMGVTFTSDRADAGSHLYFEVAAAVITLLLLGRYLESKAKRRAGAALRALLDLGAKHARVLDASGAEREVAIEHLAVGDRFVVRPGEQVATDGVVEDGTSAIDAALVTGESVPVEVGPGDAVVGATVNVGGRLVVRATRVGADTHLARIGRLVSDAQSGKAEVQRLADRVAGVFVPVVLVIAAATLVTWLALGEPAASAFTAAVAVLVIACPCALGLATPTALLVGTGRGAQLGIVIRGPEAIEQAKRVDTIVLDKTGTITSGSMEVAEVVPALGWSRATVLALAGAAEDASEHPIGRAIARAARTQAPDGVLATVSGFRATAGVGVTGTVGERRVEVRRPGGRAPARAGTVVEVTVDDVVAGWIVVTDTIKPTSAEAVRELRALGLEPVLLTGDRAATARAVADEVGIETVFSDVLPEDKVAVVTTLQAKGHAVAMVGDGVNDAAALAAADLGMAMGTGADAAIEASDITLVRGDLRSAVDAVRLSRRTLATIRGNLVWAFAYNVAAIPLAATGRLGPLVAAAAMAASSLFVVTNSLRLRRFAPSA